MAKKENKSYLVFQDGQHEYDLKVEERKDGGTKYTLYRSHSDRWNNHVRGVKCLSVIDGDSEMEIKGVKGSVPYHTMYELKLVLDFIMSEHDNGEVKIIEDKVVKTFK